MAIFIIITYIAFFLRLMTTTMLSSFTYKILYLNFTYDDLFSSYTEIKVRQFILNIYIYIYFLLLLFLKALRPERIQRKFYFAYFPIKIRSRKDI